MPNTKLTSQTGSVRQKGKQWYYRFRTLDPDGISRQHEYKGGKNKRETEALLRQALEDYRNKGFLFEPGDYTVIELGEMWYQDEIEHSTLTTNGRNDYLNVLRHIREHSLGDTKLRNVTCELLQAYVDEKYYGAFDDAGNQIKHAYSESHMRKQFVVLNNMFKYSVYPKHLLRENPMQYIKRRKKEKAVSLFDDDSETKVETISYSEYLKLEEHLSSHETDPYLLLPVQIAYHTGLRAGEVCGLTWQDINLSEQYLRVRRSMYYDSETKCWELKVPKNGKTRIVDFGDSLAKILRNARKDVMEEQLRYGNLYQKHYYQVKEIKTRTHYQIFTELASDSEVLSSRSTKGKFIDECDPKQPLTPLQFVCTKPGGELLTTQTLKWCNKLIQKEIPTLSHFHFHMLRHSFASTLVTNGANFKDVQELMGHSDIRITLNTYSHVTPHSRKKAVSVFEQAIAR